MNSPSDRIVQVGRARFDPLSGRLELDGQARTLRPRTAACLAHLVRHAGRAVTKDELMAAVWPDAVVTEDSLVQCIKEIRQAFGDAGRDWIRTLPRQGYALVAMADDAPSPPASPGAPAPADAPAAPAARHPLRRPGYAAGAATVLALLLGLFAWQARAPAPDIGAELAQRRSIAVMPFTDLSEPKAPHVAYAVDQALSTDLGRLDDTTVIARESSAALGSSETVDPKRAGRELGVRHLLAGSVRLEGAGLVVSLRLLRTDTGALLWSDRFDYPSVADWATQADILARVANELDTRVGKTIVEQAARSPHSGRAIDHWMRGRYIMWTVSSQAQLMEARQHFDAALAAQPQSVHALTGLAFTHIVEVIHRWSKDPKQSLATAHALARQALDIAPDHHAALKALAGAQMFAGDLAGSTGTTQRLLALNPNDAHANRDLAANLFFQGRWPESLRQLAVAERLNPLDASHMWKVNDMATIGLIATQRYDEAIERARRNAVLHPSSIGPLTLTAAAEAHRGNLSAARAAAAEVMKRDPTYFVGKGRGGRGSTAPAYLQGLEHVDAGLRLAGLPATRPGLPP